MDVWTDGPSADGHLRPWTPGSIQNDLNFWYILKIRKFFLEIRNRIFEKKDKTGFPTLTHKHDSDNDKAKMMSHWFGGNIYWEMSQIQQVCLISTTNYQNLKISQKTRRKILIFFSRVFYIGVDWFIWLHFCHFIINFPVFIPPMASFPWIILSLSILKILFFNHSWKIQIFWFYSNVSFYSKMVNWGLKGGPSGP